MNIYSVRMKALIFMLPFLLEGGVVNAQSIGVHTGPAATSATLSNRIATQTPAAPDLVNAKFLVEKLTTSIPGYSPTNSTVFCLNNLDQVLGINYLGLNSNGTLPTLWTTSGAHSVPTPDYFTTHQAKLINDFSQFVTNVAGNSLSPRCNIYSFTGTDIRLDRSLPYVEGGAINNLGWVLCRSYDAKTKNSPWFGRHFILKGNGQVNLALPPGATTNAGNGATLYGMNFFGESVGDAGTGGNSDCDRAVFIGSDGKASWLSSISVTDPNLFETAGSLNDRGQIIGTTGVPDPTDPGWFIGVPAYWENRAANIELLPGQYKSWGGYANGINRWGQIVGVSDTTDGVIWVNQKQIDFRSGIINPDHLRIFNLVDINDNGIIVGDDGTGINNFLLRPTWPQLAVDANRDGQIKFRTLGIVGDTDTSDNTTAAKPFRFWLNDDDDRTGLTPSEATVQDDGDPSKYPNDRDWQRDQITCARDLEDFARLWISTQGLNNSIKPKADGTADLYLGLKWTNITRGAPAIKLYRAADADGGTGYLVTPATAQQQVDPAGAGYGNAITVSPEGGGTVTTLLDGTTGFILPASVFANLTDAQPKTFLLFEGCKTGAGQLQLVIYDKTGTKIGEGPSLYLDLKNVKEMYERWTVGDGSDAGLTGAGGGGGAPNPTAALSQDRLPSGVGAFQFGAKQTADDNNYILYVHGWNMPPWEKDAFAETAFKRLYWQGYKGRFGAYQWPNTYHHFSIDGATDYDRGEYSAWLSALPLKNLLTSLHGQSGYNVSVLAHSMGNVVTGEALRIAGQAGTSGLVSTYVASQAAVPAHCYDPSLTGSTNLLNYSGAYFITTPNIYNNWLVAPQSAAGARSNFNNANDYALSFWETNQKLKPDGSDALYYYLGIDSLDIVDDAFGKWIFFPIPHPLHLGDATNVQDRYEIMARAAQARSKALGAVPAVAGFVPQNLPSLWPVDTFPQTNGPYSAHPWHSAQFRFTNADQKSYWHALLDQFGLLPL